MLLRLYARAARAGRARCARTRSPRRGRLPSGRTRADALLADARRIGSEASAITPDGRGWLVLAEAEYERVLGGGPTELWTEAAETWQRLERPPLAAYCRWRLAEALVRDRASRAEASAPLQRRTRSRRGSVRDHSSGSSSCSRERARLELSRCKRRARRKARPRRTLGLTTARGEVLALVARGLTNREIAGSLVISVKTASVHVSHILRKLERRPARGRRDRAPARAPAGQRSPNGREIGDVRGQGIPFKSCPRYVGKALETGPFSLLVGERKLPHGRFELEA